MFGVMSIAKYGFFSIKTKKIFRKLTEDALKYVYGDACKTAETCSISLSYMEESEKACIREDRFHMKNQTLQPIESR